MLIHRVQRISVVYVPSVGSMCQIFVALPQNATVRDLKHIVGERMQATPFTVVSQIAKG